MNRSKVLFAAISVVLAGTSGAPVAYAQAQASSTMSLEEVVVTARKRAETLIEVPVSVSVLTQEDIRQRGVQNLQDVALFTPGLTYFDSIQNQLGVPVIRGISQTNILSPDRNVAIFYGGVYLANSNASNLQILDIERIEVVKGPQSALYGRNAFNGAINYVPAAPTKDFRSTVEATTGSDSRYEVRFMASGPLSDTLGGRIAGSYNTFDGTWANAGDPYHNLGGYETKNVSGMLDWNPTEAFNARAFGYYTDDVRGAGAMYFVPAFNCGPTGRPLSAWCGDIPDPTTLAANRDSMAFKRRVSVGSLEFSYDFGPVALKGQFARNKAVTDGYSDYSGGANNGLGELYPIVNVAAPTVVLRQQKVPYFTGGGESDSLSTSQELRLESRQDARLRWTLGAFHFKTEARTVSQFVFDGRGLAVGEYPRDLFAIASRPGGTNYTNPWDVQAKTAEDQRVDKQTAFFGAADFKVTDAITVGGELRHDKEDRSTESLLTGPASHRETTFSYETWRFHADYAFSPEQRVYVSAAKGVISGFFNATTDPAAPPLNGQVRPVPVEYQTYDPAENITYELGWKASWLDNRLSTEMSLFYIDYTGVQINITPPPETLLVSSLIQNIGDATGKGVELSLNYAVNDNWRVGATYSYTPTEFKDGTPDPSVSRYCGGTAGLQAGFCPSIVYRGVLQPDVSGQQLPRSPDRLASGYVMFDMPLSGEWSTFARADVSYTSSTPVFTMPHLTSIGSHTLTNARVGVRNGPLQLELWARNLFDEEYVAAAINQPKNNAAGSAVLFLPNPTMGEGRTYGLTASYAFGGR